MFRGWPLVGAALALRSCDAAVLRGRSAGRGIPNEPMGYIEEPPLIARQNPYQSSSVFNVVEDRGEPIAPMDDVRAGIEGQSYIGGPGEVPELMPVSAQAAYRPYAKHDPYETFPQTYGDDSESIRKARLGARPMLACVDSPWNWKDMRGFDCQTYVAHGWCSSSGRQTQAWPSWWGQLRSSGGRGLPANKACCACGGGIQTLVSSRASTPIENRRLVASADRVADHLAEGTKPVLSPRAPKDAIPIPYVHYFGDLERQKQIPLPMGLTGRFFGFLPGECSRPTSTAIVRGIDYRIAGEGGSRSRLDHAIENNRRSVGGYFWAKFSGTMKIFTPGIYTFNLRLGFDTESTFQVDAQMLLTYGQCYYGRDLENCHERGCVWLLATERCVPYATDDEVRQEQEAAKAAAAYQIVVNGAKVPGGQAGAPGPAPASSASMPLGAGAPSAAPSPSAAFAPGPAPAALLETGARHRSRARAAGGRGPSPAPAPQAAPAPPPMGASMPGGASMPFGASLANGAGLVNGSLNGTNSTLGAGGAGGAGGKYGDVDWAKHFARLKAKSGVRPNQLDLTSGGHCIEILLAVTPEGRSLQLTYEGPDTGGTMTVMPGQIMWCDPVIDACENPAMDTCAFYRPRCSGMDMPFKGPAPRDYSTMPRATMPGGAGLAPGALSAVLPGALLMPGATPMEVAKPDRQAAAILPPAAGAPAPAPMGLQPRSPPAGLMPVFFAAASPPEVGPPMLAEASPDSAPTLAEEEMTTM